MIKTGRASVTRYEPSITLPLLYDSAFESLPVQSLADRTSWWSISPSPFSVHTSYLQGAVLSTKMRTRVQVHCQDT